MRENALISTDQNDRIRKRDPFRQDARDANREIGVPMGVEARWFSRGYLPRFESCEAIQHVTFHLADSVARKTFLRIESELKFLPDEKRDAERRKRLDAWLDGGLGSCVLRESRTAEMMQGALLRFGLRRYRLLAWVIMPNHVHVLFQPLNGWTVAKIVASCRNFRRGRFAIGGHKTGKRPVALCGIESIGTEYIRDAKHLAKAIEYTHMNPVKAGLADRAEDWRWSSAHFKKGKAGVAPTGHELQVRGIG